MNKKQITVEEFQKLLLLAMKYFDSVCKELNIKYYLTFGTLIGAVRHKGFIPWDDDVDIYIFREDYDKLKAYFDSQKDSNYMFKGIDGDTFPSLGRLYNKNYKIELRRLETYLHIDVFILDKCPIDKGEQIHKKISSLRKLYRFTKEKLEGMAPYNPQSRKLLKINKFIPFTIFFNSNYLRKKILNVLTKYSGLTDDNYMVIDYFNLDKIGLLNCDVFGQPLENQFEDTIFPIPKGYDTLLSKIFGDYMTPPPESKRFVNPVYLLEE
ncbi:MAG: LicD family protein [Abditibacteriota bacterium]|nr:LicD family protein [Abditibacteriota bacterium]